MTATRRPGPGIRALHFAGNVSGAYLLGGLAWLGLREAIGRPVGSDLPGLEYAVHPLSLLVVFPLSQLVSYVLFRLRSLSSGFTPVWRPWAAGVSLAVMIWSNVGTELNLGMEAMSRRLPNIPGLVFVAVLSPFAMGVFLSHLLLWGPRPRIQMRREREVR
jgi:hypothetical protein